MSSRKKRVIGIIPARYASVRFQGKPLADIHGKPMIWWTYHQAKKARLLTDVVVATEDERIGRACEELSMPYVMTGKNHKTGTDRVAEAARYVRADIYINVQGDEPIMDPKIIDVIAKAMLEDPSIHVLNLMSEITEMHELVSSTVPKVVVNTKNEAMCYSRLPIPFPKGHTTKYRKQIGMYGFRPEALKKFAALPQGPMEQSEEIELFRFVENAIPVKMIEVKSDNVAVDTPADLEFVKKIIAKRMKKSGTKSR